MDSFIAATILRSVGNILHGQARYIDTSAPFLLILFIKGCDGDE